MTDREAQLRAALSRLHSSVLLLAARGNDGLTYFEGSPTKDDERQRRWQELNDAQAQAKTVLGAIY